MERTEVIVIGGGMAGASLAYELSAKCRVVLLERESQPGYHSTGRSAAVFSETYGHPVVRSLTVGSRPFFENPPPGFSQHRLLGDLGVLTIARPDQEARARRAAEEMHAAFPVIRLLDAAEARRIVPILRPEYVACGILKPNVMSIDVHALLQGFLRGARERGTHIVTDAEVLDLQRDHATWRVITRAGELHADIVVNAAGAWADELAERAGVTKIGLTPKRRTAMILAPPAGVEIKAWPNTVDFDEAFYFKPEAGMILASPCDETSMPPCDVQPDEIDIAQCVDRVQKAANLPVRRVERAWAGLRSFVADRVPAVGFDEKAAGFFWLAGQGGYGIQTAPAMGQLAASLVLKQAIPPALQDVGVAAEALDPARLRRSGGARGD